MPVAVQIHEPARATSPVVFASPHSGRVYPADLMAQAQVPELVLRSSSFKHLLNGIRHMEGELLNNMG